MAEAGQALTTQTAAVPEAKPSGVGQLSQMLGGDVQLRRAGLIVGLVAAIAVGVGLFFWAQEPVYKPLYGDLAEQDAVRVMEALESANIPHRIDSRSGMISVPAGEVHSVRLRMAAQGLPRGGGVGFELLERDQSFGTSQFMESARFQRALETELARSIGALQAVESARVHLAIPKQSVFVRERSQPRASVIINLAPGRGLSDGQVQAIVHLVASSVPELSDQDVTLVDHRGRLLSRTEDEPLGGTARQFEHKQQLEQMYARRVENLLAPVVGKDRVRAEVSARLDFSTEESTAELFDPAGVVVRSEQTQEERRRRSEREAMGIPGALTNQPPAGGDLDVQIGNPDGAEESMDHTQSATRNFEVSKTVRHTRRPVGGIERLSVAVLVDQKEVMDEDGIMAREPHTDAELEQLTALVRDAVGFDAERGDTVNVISAAFYQGDAAQAPVAVPLMEQPWVWELGKLGLALLLALVLILAVIRPLAVGLVGTTKREAGADEGAADQPRLEGQASGAKQLPGPETDSADEVLFGGQLTSYESALTAARQVVSQEPGLAANVVKNWLGDD